MNFFLLLFCFLHRAPSDWLDIRVLCYTKMLLAKWLTRESALFFPITIHSLPFTLLRTPSIVFSFYKWKLFNHWTFCRTADHVETHFWSSRCAQYRHDLSSGHHYAFHAVIHSASCGYAHGIIFHSRGLGDQNFNEKNGKHCYFSSFIILCSFTKSISKIDIKIFLYSEIIFRCFILVLSEFRELGLLLVTDFLRCVSKCVVKLLKLSLCLNREGNGGIFPHILELGTRFNW